MQSGARGDAFERKAFRLVEELLTDGVLGVMPGFARAYRGKGYYSSDRKSAINFDISIEILLPGASTYSFLWLWECKDYTHPIPVDDVEEFHSKVQQVSGVNVKAGILTSGVLQKSAFEFARSKGMSVVRIVSEGDPEWLLYSGEAASQVQKASIDATITAITDPSFRCTARSLFGVSGQRSYDSMGKLLSDGLRSLIEDQSGESADR